MQSPTLPPIQLLAAFEAAARLGSFKLAAKALHVTPSAISQQLRALEDALGLALFERKPRAIGLTDAGRFYLEVARETLDVFRRGTARLQERFARRTLRVNSELAVAYEVIIPGLADFQARHADVDLRIETSSSLVDPRTEAVDAAVRFGRGPWPGLCAEPLSTMFVTPVASPKLLEERELRSPADLSKHTLLSVQGTPDPWALAAAQHGFRVGRTQAFDSYWATLQAAAHGIGVALGVFPLSTAWVRDGRLTAPLPLRERGFGHFLVYRPEDQERGELALLRDWLRARFAHLEALDRDTPPAPPARPRRPTRKSV